MNHLEKYADFYTALLIALFIFLFILSVKIDSFAPVGLFTIGLLGLAAINPEGKQ